MRQVMAQPEQEPAIPATSWATTQRIIGARRTSSRMRRGSNRARSCRADFTVERVKRDLLDNQGSLAPDHLDGFGQSIPHHCRPQDVVPSNHRPQGADKAIQPLARIKAQQFRIKVNIALNTH